MQKRTEKHENKEQVKTPHETPRSKIHKSTHKIKQERDHRHRMVGSINYQGLKHFYCQLFFTMGPGEKYIKGSFLSGG